MGSNSAKAAARKEAYLEIAALAESKVRPLIGDEKAVTTGIQAGALLLLAKELRKAAEEM